MNLIFLLIWIYYRLVFSFTSVGAMNVIILASPQEYSGVNLGVSSLLRIIGCAIGPALAAMYMKINQTNLSVNKI